MLVSKARDNRVPAGRLRYELLGAGIAQARNLRIDMLCVRHDSTRHGRIITWGRGNKNSQKPKKGSPYG
jgi:hypothetical protein